MINSDPDLSQVWIELNGGFGNDLAEGHLHFQDSNGSLDRIQWDSNGLLASQGPTSSPIQGHLIQDTSRTAGLGYRYICYGVTSGTTNAGGQQAFAHGAPFTPAFIFATSTGATQTYTFSSIGATNATVTVYTQAGALVGTGGYNFWYACIGD